MKLFRYDSDGCCGFSGDYYISHEWYVTDENNEVKYYKTCSDGDFFKYNGAKKVVGEERKINRFLFFTDVINHGWHFERNIEEEEVTEKLNVKLEFFGGENHVNV